MLDLWNEKGEKKVEYIDLIYDLIFVYLVSRNGSLLHTMEGGFITATAFLTYILSSLIILQIWYFSTLLINRYGNYGIKEHLCIFINMYLLYFMADGIRANWGGWYYRYNGAWALILLNLTIQYFLQLRNNPCCAAPERQHIKYHMRMLIAEAVIVLITMPIYALTGIALSPWGMVFGFAVPILSHKVDELVPVDFPHLSERVMLYVVFTFGEMILAIAGYFSGEFSLWTIFYSLMAFLIVVGLFSTYGYFYNHLLDRDMKTTGTVYMLIHIVLILALNNITASLEFMRERSVSAVPKTIFMVVSVLVFFVCVLLTQGFATKHVANGGKFYWALAATVLVYCILTALFYQLGYINIILTTVFIYLQYIMLRRTGTYKLSKDTPLES